MAICNAKDEDIKAISEGKDKLKSLMSGDLSSIEGMEEAQKGMKQGFDLLAGKSVGPVKICQCKGYDESLLDTDSDFNVIHPTTEVECTNAGGFWECKEVENFNLQEEMLKLNDASTSTEFSEKIADLKAKFGDAVDDLDEQISKVSPAIGDFIKNFKLPDLSKKSGCDIFGNGEIDYTVSEEDCAAWGGTWVTKDIDIAADIQGGIQAASDFLANAASSAGDAISNLASGADLKFPSEGIPAFPKPGEKVEICNCSIPEHTDKASCEEAGGVWECKMGIAPDIGSFFGDDGLPKISPDTLCNALPDIEVKNQLVTDPSTGKTTIEKVKDILPAAPVVPKEEPKTAEPAPTSDKDLKDKSTDALIAQQYAQRVVIKVIKTMLTKYALEKDVAVSDAFTWCLKNAFYSKCGRDLDTESNLFTYAKPHPIKREEAEKGYEKYKTVLKNNGKETNHPTVDDRTDHLWSVIVKYYNKQSYVKDPYLNEAGLIKWCKEWFAEMDAKQEAPQKKQEELKEAVEKKEPVTTDAALAEIDPVPAELTGIQTTARTNIQYNADIVKANRTGRLFILKSDKTDWAARTQIEFDTSLRVAQSKKAEIINHPSSIRGRKGVTLQSVFYYHEPSRTIRQMALEQYGLTPKQQEKWDKRKASEEFKKRVAEAGVKVAADGSYSV
jgi:hypothetical protein